MDHLAYGVYAIHCGNCSAADPFAATEDKAIEIWNERAGRLADDNHTPVDTIETLRLGTSPSKAPG